MRQIVRAALPLGVGVEIDSVIGSGSTTAIELSVGYERLGLETDPIDDRMAAQAVPKLATPYVESVWNIARSNAKAEQLPVRY